MTDTSVGRRKVGRYTKIADAGFQTTIWGFTILYAGLLIALVAVIGTTTDFADVVRALKTPSIIASTKLSLMTATIAAIASLWFAVPIGYLLVRHDFPGKAMLDAVIDIPIVLPPLVVGLCLLILFQTAFGQWFENKLLRCGRITFQQLFCRSLSLHVRLPFEPCA